MPRRSKHESNHDKVIPLTLPEVQIAVANSISRDRIDEEAAIRAVQGYELLVQGSLKNNQSQKTKQITGHGGYYRNMMRGVAQVFGIRKLPQHTDQVVRNASSSDSEEYGPNRDDVTDEHLEPPLKKSRTEHRADHAVPESSEQAFGSKPRRDEESSSESDKESLSDKEVTEVTEETTEANREELTVTQIAPSSITENPISQPQVLTVSLPADDTSTASLPKKSFNRYNHRSRRATSEKRKDETGTTEKSGQRVIDKEERSRTTEILEEAEKGGKDDGSGSRGVRNEEGRGGEQQSTKQDHEESDHVATKDEGTERHSTERELSGQSTDNSSSQGRRTSLEELNSEDITTLAKEIAEKEDMKLYIEQDSIQTIENSILPGTWMFNHKKLSKCNFLNPEESSSYFMIRSKPVWQMVLYRHMKDICAVVDSDGPIEAATISFPISVLFFDNEDLSIDEKVVLGIHNFVNGLLRSYIHKKYTNSATEKKKIANVKHVLEAVTSRIVQVAMPRAEIPSMNAAYMLANLHYLGNSRNIESILSQPSSSDSTRKFEVKPQKGKKKVSISTQIIRVDASDVYSHNYVEPILAL